MPTRREFPGGAVVETLAGSMSTSSLNVVISGNAGWTFGAGGPFACVINQGYATEEKVLCSSLVGTTLTFTRGYDGTSPQNHQPGETISPCVTAVDLDEANLHTSSNSGVHGTSGAVADTISLQTLSNKTLLAPIIADLSNMTHTHLNSATGGLIGGFFNSPEWTTVTTGGTSDPNALTIPHGAPFTPTRALVGYANLNGSFTSWNSYHFSAANATNVYVSFYTGTTPVIPATITVRMIVFP